LIAINATKQYKRDLQTYETTLLG